MANFVLFCFFWLSMRWNKDILNFKCVNLASCRFFLVNLLYCHCHRQYFVSIYLFLFKCSSSSLIIHHWVQIQLCLNWVWNQFFMVVGRRLLPFILSKRQLLFEQNQQQQQQRNNCQSMKVKEHLKSRAISRSRMKKICNFEKKKQQQELATICNSDVNEI